MLPFLHFRWFVLLHQHFLRRAIALPNDVHAALHLFLTAAVQRESACELARDILHGLYLVCLAIYAIEDGIIGISLL